jgi:hypothetical protein
MTGSAAPRRDSRRAGLDLDRADIATRSEGPAQPALINGEIGAGKTDATGRISSLDCRAS